MRFPFFILLAIATLCGRSQTVRNLDSIINNPNTGIYVRNLFNDSLSSSFCILIPDEVKAHKHQHHCEHVLVLEGEGLMKLGAKEFMIRKHDLIFIPANTVHSVRSPGPVPLKVLSIQAPYFDGSDRVYENVK